MINQSLRNSSLMIVLAYSPAGLGHLRVTDALYRGMPSSVVPTLLGSQDKNITTLHRLTSLHPLLRSLFEWGQSQGTQQYFFTYLYRVTLTWGTKLLYKQIVTLIEQRVERPKTLLFIATHFGLAHQIAVLKEKIMSEQKVKIVLAVIVTDDSPQFIWYVPGADFIFVPSFYTKKQLQKYARESKLGKANIMVNPYPLNLALAKELSDHRWEERLSQFSEKEQRHIHIIFPVSGAAVGMPFFVKLIDSLYQKCPRFVFHIVAKTSLYTLPYLNELMSRPYVEIHLGSSDREVVNIYDKVYQQHTIAIEITKPSEQAFKALINVNRVGGSLLLFAEPVGRQEVDNLNFLVRHGLIPNVTEQRKLWRLADHGHKFNDKECLEKIKNWRGVVLPHHSERSTNFIWWCYREGLLKTMVSHIRKVSFAKENQGEVDPHGVETFWETMAKAVEEN